MRVCLCAAFHFYLKGAEENSHLQHRRAISDIVLCRISIGETQCGRTTYSHALLFFQPAVEQSRLRVWDKGYLFSRTPLCCRLGHSCSRLQTAGAVGSEPKPVPIKQTWRALWVGGDTAEDRTGRRCRTGQDRTGQDGTLAGWDRSSTRIAEWDKDQDWTERNRTWHNRRTRQNGTRARQSAT